MFAGGRALIKDARCLCNGQTRETFDSKLVSISKITPAFEIQIRMLNLVAVEHTLIETWKPFNYQPGADNSSPFTRRIAKSKYWPPQDRRSSWDEGPLAVTGTLPETTTRKLIIIRQRSHIPARLPRGFHLSTSPKWQIFQTKKAKQTQRRQARFF